MAEKAEGVFGAKAGATAAQPISDAVGAGSGSSQQQKNQYDPNISLELIGSHAFDGIVFDMRFRERQQLEAAFGGLGRAAFAEYLGPNLAPVQGPVFYHFRLRGPSATPETFGILAPPLQGALYALWLIHATRFFP